MNKTKINKLEKEIIAPAAAFYKKILKFIEASLIGGEQLKD
jgi:hypothetical protein